MKKWMLFAGLCFFSLKGAGQGKKQEAGAARLSGLKNFIENFSDAFVKEKPRMDYGVFPTLGYEKLTSWKIGVMPFVRFKTDKTDRDGAPLPPTTLIFDVSGSVKGSVSSELELSSFMRRWRLQSKFGYFRIKNVFYGIGDPVPEAEASRYHSQRFSWEGNLQYAAKGGFLAGLNLDCRRVVNQKAAGEWLAGPVRGMGRSFIAGLGPKLTFDSRNSPTYPTKGQLLDCKYTAYLPELGSKYRFTALTVDLRSYHAFFGGKSTLAVQAVLDCRDGEAPFYHLPELGGARRLRGIDPPARYIDRNLYLAQAEWRQELWWRFGLVAFAGAGNSASRLDGALWEDVKLVYGLGGRFQLLPSDRLNIRMDLGFGPDGNSGTYISISEAF